MYDLLFAAREFNMNKPTITKELMYCVCGFSTDSGNKMAAHLARSGCRTAYPSAEEAAKARVDVTSEEATVTVNKDKTDEDKTNEEPDNMETDTVSDGVGDKGTERISGGNEEVSEETKKIEERKDSDSDFGKETTKEVEDGEEEKKMEEENGDTNDSEKGETNKDEDEQAPAAGGILFGTLFNYMNQKEDEDK